MTTLVSHLLLLLFLFPGSLTWSFRLGRLSHSTTRHLHRTATTIMPPNQQQEGLDPLLSVLTDHARSCEIQSVAEEFLSVELTACTQTFVSEQISSVSFFAPLCFLCAPVGKNLLDTFQYQRKWRTFNFDLCKLPLNTLNGD